MRVYGYAVLILGTIAWVMPFILHQRNTAKPAEMGPRANGGLTPASIRFTLVRSGIYAVIRHPIYCSIAFGVAGTALILTPGPLVAAGLVAFTAGTLIRVRIEDALLARRFGREFDEYRAHVPAFIPRLRFRSF